MQFLQHKQKFQLLLLVVVLLLALLVLALVLVLVLFLLFRGITPSFINIYCINRKLVAIGIMSMSLSFKFTKSLVSSSNQYPKTVSSIGNSLR